MSYIDEMLKKLCPSGVEYKKVKDEYTRIRGTAITAGKMKEIANDEGNIRIFAGGKTVIDAFEKDIPNANITQVPAVLVQSRGIIDVVYYDKPFTFKNEMWAYTHEEQLSVKYLYYVLKINVPKFQNAASGMGSMPQISLPVTEELEIPVPPLEVQREIVQILDKFTLLSAELSAELSARKKQYEYYKSSLFDFDESVPTIKIGDFTRVFSASRVHKSDWKSEGVPFWRSSDLISFYNGVENSRGKVYISQELYEKLSAKSGKIEENDILVTGGGTIGIPYIVPSNDPFYVKDADLLCIKKNDVVMTKYLYHYFLSQEFKDYLMGITHDATIAHYTISQIKDTPIPVPSIDKQKKIVEILDKFEDLTKNISVGLPAEIEARNKQYEYYRDKLLTFDKAV